MTTTNSEELTACLLQATIQALRREVVPSLTNPSAMIHADLITRVLYMLYNRFSSRGADLERLLADDQALLNQISALLPGDGKAITSPKQGDHFSAVEKLERQVMETELNLAGKIPQLLELVKGTGSASQAAAASLRGIVEAQRTFLAAQDPDILKGSYVCYQGGRIEEERQVERPALFGAEINDATLTAHLQKQFPGSRVGKVSTMAGGFSKTTIFFTLVHASGEAEALVIRKDLPAELNSSVADEFPLLQKLYQAGFPVAEPRFLEADPKPFGGCFMASRRVSGTTDFARWASDAVAVDNFARQLAKVMVDLHALKLGTLGFADDIADKSAGDLMRVEIRRWKDVFTSTRMEAFPIEELSMAWLEANIPAALFSRPAVLVHGDIGFHNLMIDSGRVTALLDWEFSHPGDPVEDLVYTKPFIEKVMDWETFKSYYREYGGAECTPEEEFFYTVWSKARNQSASIRAGSVFAKSLKDNLAFASAGFILGRYLELEAGQMIVDALDA